MARQSKKEMIDLEPVDRGTSIKIDRVTISFESTSPAKIRFSHKGKPFIHGVGRLDNKTYRNQVIETCKAITTGLRSFFKSFLNELLTI